MEITEIITSVHRGTRKHGLDARNIQGVVFCTDEKVEDGGAFREFAEFIMKGNYHNRYNLCLDTMALKTFYCQNGDAQKQAFLVDSVTVTA